MLLHGYTGAAGQVGLIRRPPDQYFHHIILPSFTVRRGVTSEEAWRRALPSIN